MKRDLGSEKKKKNIRENELGKDDDVRHPWLKII
jgi:hypothetical protein